MRGARQAAWEEELTRAELRLGDPGLDRFSRLVGQFALHRLPGLLLHGGHPGNGFSAMGHITYLELDEVAASKFAVNREIEQGEVPGPVPIAGVYGSPKSLLASRVASDLSAGLVPRDVGLSDVYAIGMLDMLCFLHSGWGNTSLLQQAHGRL